MTNFEKVKQFMTTFGQEVKQKPEFPSENIIDLRIKLIEEELQELKDSIKNKDIIEVADALTDILVVTYGVAARAGGLGAGVGGPGGALRGPAGTGRLLGLPGRPLAARLVQRGLRDAVLVRPGGDPAGPGGAPRRGLLLGGRPVRPPHARRPGAEGHAQRENRGGGEVGGVLIF